MRWLVAILWMVLPISGCAPGPVYTMVPPAAAGGQPLVLLHDNPTLLPIADHQCAWETVVDVIDDYFEIEREEPVRLIGEELTGGWLETYPQPAATIFEPWRGDSVGRAERIENTLQSMRRRAVVRVEPTQGGFLVDVAVFKELEDVVRPEHATAGAATFRYDNTLTRVVNPVGEQEINRGWIPQGRDTALEQRILGHLQSRSGRGPMPLTSWW